MLGERIAENNFFNWLFDKDIESFTLTVGEYSVTGRGVYFFYVAVALLSVSGLLALIARKKEINEKWFTWVSVAVIVGIPMWAGKLSTVPLAVIIATIAVWEYNKLVQLPKWESLYLHGLAILYPVLAYSNVDLLQLAPLFTLLCAIPSLIEGDVENGVKRTTMAAFGSIWICWSLAFLVILWKDAFLVCFAIAAADVGAWCGGKGFKKFAWARKSLSKLSPNKTVGGLAGGILGASIMLSILGSITFGLVLAIGVGAVLGDLLESMIKRQVGVKDAGTWLPGFGGLLDRIDSWLLVLPVVAVLGVWLG